MVLKKMIGDNVIKGKENAENREGMNDERVARENDPTAAVIGIRLFSNRCADVAKGAE